MKANELMIGDWVLHNTYPEKIKLIGNTMVKVCNCDDTIGIDEICPIPLTVEILEKNGFTRDANDMNDSDELVVSLEYGEYQRNTEDGFMMLSDGKAIKYVHELQHGLRLCDVEKEIEL